MIKTDCVKKEVMDSTGELWMTLRALGLGKVRGLAWHSTYDYIWYPIVPLKSLIGASMGSEFFNSQI